MKNIVPVMAHTFSQPFGQISLTPSTWVEADVHSLPAAKYTTIPKFNSLSKEGIF